MLKRLIHYMTGNHSSPYWIRVLASSMQGFEKHQSPLKAALLTYYTLLSIVPVLAMAFGIAKGFNFEPFFENQLLMRFADQKVLIKKVIDFAHNLLKQTQGGVLVSIGFLTLFWTVINLFGTIEGALNEIWGVKKSRTLNRKITDYFALIIFAPFFFVFSNSGALYLIHKVGNFSLLSPIATLFISWILFGFIYFVMPNTKVSLKYGILAGIVGGTLYQIVQWIYITFQVGVSNMGAIYGSFAALPLFLVWVYMSWMIFLFGAEIGYFAEDENYAAEKKNNRTESNKAEISLLITIHCIQAFCREEPPLSLKELSTRLQIPGRVTREIVNELIQSRILVEISEDSTFLPAKHIDLLTIQSVLEALDHNSPIIVRSTPELIKIQKLLEAFEAAGKNSQENKLLKDFI